MGNDLRREHARKVSVASSLNGIIRIRSAWERRPPVPEHMQTTRAFVDTNVLLYAASTDPLEAQKRNAARAILSGSPVCFSVQLAQEFYVNATRKLKPPLSRTDVLHFLKAISPVTVYPVDYELFEEATQISDRFQISYWDAAVVAAAKRLNCPILYSEDLSDGQNFDGTVVANPFRALAKT